MRRRAFVASLPLAAAGTLGGLNVEAAGQEKPSGENASSETSLPKFQPAGAERFLRPDVHAGDRPSGASFASRSAAMGRSGARRIDPEALTGHVAPTQFIFHLVVGVLHRPGLLPMPFQQAPPIYLVIGNDRVKMPFGAVLKQHSLRLEQPQSHIPQSWERIPTGAAGS